MQTVLSQRWSLLLLCLVWGILESLSFFGLGGTFVGLIPANIVLLLADLLQAPLTQASALRVLLPVITALFGLCAAGVWLRDPIARHQADDGFWLVWMMFFSLALLTTALPNSPVVSMQAFVVGLTALALGFQIGILYQLKPSAATVRVTKARSVLDACLCYPVSLLALPSPAPVLWSFVSFLLGFWLGQRLLDLGFDGIFWAVVILMVPATILLSNRHRAA